MLSFKEISNKVASNLVYAAIVGLAYLLYAEYQTYQDLKELPKIKVQLETKFKKRMDSLIRVEKSHNYDIKRLKAQSVRDSTNLHYVKSWVDYWRGNQ